MNSTLALIFPAASLLYLLQTVLRKNIRILIKILLALPALLLFVVDLFTFLVFYVNCYEAGRYFHDLDCVNWIYPTIDFKIMVIISIILLFAGLYGLTKKWNKKKYYLIASLLIYMGLAARLFVLTEAAGAIAMANDSNNPVVFEIFSIVVVYGLVSSVIYLSVFLLGLFSPVRTDS